MKAKILLNTAYTIGIVLCIITLIWGYQHSRYEFVMAAVLVGATFIVLKIRLLKEVKSIINNRKP